MQVNGLIEWACGCRHRIYRVLRSALPELHTAVVCSDHGETEVARTTYVSV